MTYLDRSGYIAALRRKAARESRAAVSAEAECQTLIRERDEALERVAELETDVDRLAETATDQRMEKLEAQAENAKLRALICIMHREYVGHSDDDDLQEAEHVIAMHMQDWADELGALTIKED